MNRLSIRNAVPALAGTVALAVDLRIRPAAAVAGAALFAAVLWLMLRRQAEQHRRTRRHRLRRQIGTAALVSVGVWTALALMLALRDALSGGEDAVGPGGQLVPAPWPGTVLVAGLVAIAAVALVIAATAGSRRRHSQSSPTAQAIGGESP